MRHQFSSIQSLDRFVCWGWGWEERHETRFSRDSVPVFSVGGHHEQFWYVQGCPVFEVVHTVFPLPTTRPTEICQCLTDLHRITLLCDKFPDMINMAFNTFGWQFEPWTHLSKLEGENIRRLCTRLSLNTAKPPPYR